VSQIMIGLNLPTEGTMAYEVQFTVPERPIANKDIDFPVRKNGAKFGTLRVSKGGLQWLPAGGWKKKHRPVMTWEQLAAWFEQ
jgi:hypothetical protein